MSSTDTAVVDLAIIGGGPAGLFATFYAGLRCMSVKLIDSLEQLGGQLAVLYPEKYIYDAPGFPKILAKDLTRQLVEQAMQHHPRLCLNEEAKTVDFDEGDHAFTVRTNRASHRCRALLIAGGVGAFAPRTLVVPGAKYFAGRGLFYSVRDIESFRSKRLLIVGGGDSAVDWANTLSPLTSQLTLIHRRDRFRAHESAVAQMKQGKTRVWMCHELKGIEGDESVKRAIIVNNQTRCEESLDVDAILASIGFVTSLGPISTWGIDVEGAHIKVDTTMRTSRPGVFAAGDIVTYPGKLKLIATGFGEAATAVNHAKRYIDPAADVFPGHSSATGP